MNQFNNIKMVPQPKNMNIKLYPHQLASIYEMEKLESNNIIYKELYTKETKIGVNADISGYGKTYAMVGLIVRDKMHWNLDIPYVFEDIKFEAKGRLKTISIKRLNKLPTTLILVSQSIIGQWEKELLNTELKFTCVKSKKNILNLNAENFDVILVIPSMYNNLISTYTGYAWKRFIFDEPGHTKVPAMKELFANFYWLVTATPNCITKLHSKCEGSFMKEIINNRWTDFEYQFSDIIIKNDIEFIKSSFNIPTTNHFYHQCYQPVYNALKNFVNDNIKIMIEAGDISSAVSALGGTKTDNIFDFVKLKKREELIDIDAKIQLYTLRNDEENINNYKAKKNKILNQIDEIDEKFKNMLKESCPICYQFLKNPILEQNCQNIFCGECFFKCIEYNNKCALCRSVIDSSKIIYINTDDRDNKKTEIKYITKPEKIIEIINNNKDGKYLIFSDHNHSFNLISAILKNNNIDFLQIRGNVTSRETNIQLFKDGKIPVIFLNSTIDCAGLNLQETTDIILYHEMSSDTQNQIIARANRIGRSVSLNVHHLK